LSGNILNYIEGLKTNFGSQILEEVQNTLKSHYSARKWNVSDLKLAKEITKEAIKSIKDNETPLTNSERIQFRRELNEAIGLYND
jgi:hypothetical protein